MALELKILSPARVVANTKASQLQVPGFLGYLGILPGHAPLISELGVGELVVKGVDGASDQRFFVAGGYLEVANDKVTVLVDTVEAAADINVVQAEAAKRQAEEKLKSSSAKQGEDFEQLNLELRMATERLAVARKTH